MDYHTAEQILQEIRKSSLVDLKDDLISAAVRYAKIRVDWQLSLSDDRANNSHARSSAHDAFIDSCNILSRQMARAGESTGWRNDLGNDRQNIGDFACFIHCILGIEAG